MTEPAPCQYNRCNRPAAVRGRVGETEVALCYAHALQPDFKQTGLIGVPSAGDNRPKSVPENDL